MENGASAEIAVVGNEGIVGVSRFMGGKSTPSRAVIQSAGHSLRLNAEFLYDEFNRAGPVLHLLLRYTGPHHSRRRQEGIRPAASAENRNVSRELRRLALSAATACARVNEESESTQIATSL